MYTVRLGIIFMLLLALQNTYCTTIETSHGNDCLREVTSLRFHCNSLSTEQQTEIVIVMTNCFLTSIFMLIDEDLTLLENEVWTI
jgi:hypothetical protein